MKKSELKQIIEECVNEQLEGGSFAMKVKQMVGYLNKVIDDLPWSIKEDDELENVTKHLRYVSDFMENNVLPKFRNK